MDRLMQAYYAEEFDEDDWLRTRAHGVLERVRTQELLQRFLPAAPAVVLDVGGGTGVHAERLAASGYSVHVVDPVDRHVATAAKLPGATAKVGDARALAELDDVRTRYSCSARSITFQSGTTVCRP